MYIEFIGTSGAGKTTIVEKAADILKAEGRNVITKQRFFEDDRKRSGKILWTVLHMWVLDIRMVGYFWKWGRLTNFKNACHKTNEYIKLIHILASSKERVALWDSGFQQLFSKFAAMQMMDSHTARVLVEKQLPHDCVLVFLNTSLEEAAKRKYERASGWGAGVAIDKHTEKFANAFKITSAVQDMHIAMFNFFATQGWCTITLDGMVPPEENARILIQKLEQITKEEHHA